MKPPTSRQSLTSTNHHYLTIVATILLLAVTSHAQQPQSITLRLDLPVGHAITISTSAHTQSEAFQQQDRVLTTESLEERQHTFTCTHIDDEGSITLTKTWDRVKLFMSSGGHTTTFDSADPNSSPKSLGQQPHVAMLGKTVTIHLRPDGSLLRSDSAQELAEQFIASNEAKHTHTYLPEERKGLLYTLAKIFTATPMILPHYPRQSCVPGNSWKAPWHTCTGPTCPLLTWTLVDVRGNQARLRIEGRQDSPAKSARPTPPSSADVPSKPPFTKDWLTDLTVDINTGLITSACTTTDGTFISNAPQNLPNADPTKPATLRIHSTFALEIKASQE